MRYGMRWVFQDLSFTVEAETRFGIIGKNGSGKSTLLKIIAGILRPYHGSVELSINGIPIPEEETPLQVGFVAPYLEFYETFSAVENLGFIAKARGLKDTDQQIQTVLDRVGLNHGDVKPVAMFSTGMKQRLRLASALLHDPAILLLDEPSSTLDSSGRTLVKEIVDDHDQIVVIATNDASEIDLCSELCSLNG